MSNELINTTQFGDMVKLPDILDQNKGLADRACDKVREALAIVSDIDMSKAEVSVMEHHDAKLNELQVKLGESYTIMESRRKPFTKFFDDVKSLFTAEEKRVVEIGKELKALRDAWQKEKGRRANESEALQQAMINKKQEVLTIRAQQTITINKNFNSKVAEMWERMSAAFYKKNSDELDGYAAALKEYQPMLDANTWAYLQKNGEINALFHSADEVAAIKTALAQELHGAYAADFACRINGERDRLIELIPSRKAELARVATNPELQQVTQARIAEEVAKQQQALDAEHAQKTEATLINAEAESMNAAFDVQSEASPVVGITKGTVVKKKYVATGHKAWAALLQSWVKNEMALMTPEELQKKLGFVRTACEGRLNKGESIIADGLNRRRLFYTGTQNSIKYYDTPNH